MKIAWVCLALALPLFSVGRVAAQEEERPRRDGEMRERMIDEFDADGDGELNEEERQTARATMRERRGDRPGRGQARGGQGRGREGRGNQGRGRGQGQGDRPAPPDPNELFDRFDEDKDGQLSREEFLKLTAETRSRRGPGGPREGRPDRPRPEEGADMGPPPEAEFGRRPPVANQQEGPPGGAELAPPRGPRGPEGPGPAGRGPGGRGPGGGGPGGWAGPDPNRIFDRFDENGDDQLSREEFMQLTDWTREMRERFAEGGPRARGPRGEGAGGPGRGGPRGDRPPRPQRPDAEFAPPAEAPTADDGSA